tara:strand:+ start:39 stop:194 length:156 start_codon:yes stop_codon:yes gene_type:complete
MNENTKETIISVGTQFVLSAIAIAVNTAVATAVTHKVSKYLDGSSERHDKK